MVSELAPIQTESIQLATYPRSPSPCGNTKCNEHYVKLNIAPSSLKSRGFSINDEVNFHGTKFKIAGIHDSDGDEYLWGVQEGANHVMRLGEYPDIMRKIQLLKKAAPSASKAWDGLIVESMKTGNKEVPAVESKDGALFVLDAKLIKSANRALPELVPPLVAFQHFTQDTPTLGTLAKVASAVELRQPCLLEGETAASKTSSIEYLAALLGQPVFRLNLNGQTDTSELIGKYVPNEGTLAVAFNDLLKNIATLKSESRAIVESANVAGRALSQLESQQIARNEGLEVPDWKWQDGIIPQAMRMGAWVILDEINLAEPQILERLNSVLENMPSLTLSEHAGEKIGDRDNPVHENFRIFATMNPAEYSGRSAMSPAYKDRWLSYRFCPTPKAKEFAEMFRLLINGKQPAVEIEGTRYKANDVEPKYPELAVIGGLEEFLGRLARFHETMISHARNREIGKDFKEPYIFTRRGLLAFISYLDQKQLHDRSSGDVETIHTNPKKILLKALNEFYLDKMRSSSDRKKITDQLEALGLTDETWSIAFTTRPKPSVSKPTEESYFAQLLKGNFPKGFQRIV